MGNAHIKTPGELIGSLITINIKIWHFMERQKDESLSESERLEAANTVLSLNKRRNDLMEAIDKVLGFDNYSNTPKTY